MNISDLLGSPTFLLSAVISVMAFAVFIYYDRFRGGESGDEKVEVIVFDRMKRARRTAAKTFDGFVTYGDGGFVEDPGCAFDYRSGRIKRTGRDPLKAKRRTTLYLARVGAITPLDIRKRDNSPGEFNENRYKNLRKTTRERAVNEGKLIATRPDFAGKLLTVAAAASALLAGAAWLFVVISPSIV